MPKKRQGISLKDLQHLTRSIPFNHLVGIRVARRHRDGVTLECAVRDELRNWAGVLHGGVTAAIADVAVGVAITNHFHKKRAATTTELKINYFLPIRDGKIIARSHLIRIGKTLVVGRVDLFDSEKRLAGAALVSYMLL